MTTDYCMVICFLMIGINLIIIHSKLRAIDKIYTSWREHTLHLEKELNNLYNLQRDNGKSINEAFKRIQALEDRLEGQKALTANLEDKIKALEETVGYLEGKL